MTQRAYNASGNRRLCAGSNLDCFEGLIAATFEPRDPIKRAPRIEWAALATRTFQFRLQGVEEQQEFWRLPADLPSCVVVATRNVKTYLTRSGDTGLAPSDIGGIEVGVDLIDDSVCCTVRLSEFNKGDLVVVQVEVAVHAGSGGFRPSFRSTAVG